MNNVVERLLDAIKETERIAQAVETPGEWRFERDPDHSIAIDGEDWRFAYDYTGQHGGDYMHIAHHDPAAVLRRCAADRGLLALLGKFSQNAASGSLPLLEKLQADAQVDVLEGVIQLLAFGYGIEVTE